MRSYLQVGKGNMYVHLQGLSSVNLPGGLWLGVIGLYCGLSEDGEFAATSARYGELVDWLSATKYDGCFGLAPVLFELAVWYSWLLISWCIICMMSSFGLEMSADVGGEAIFCRGIEPPGMRTETPLHAGELEGEYPVVWWQILSGEDTSGFTGWLHSVSGTAEWILGGAGGELGVGIVNRGAGTAGGGLATGGYAVCVVSWPQEMHISANSIMLAVILIVSFVTRHILRFGMKSNSSGLLGIWLRPVITTTWAWIGWFPKWYWLSEGVLTSRTFWCERSLSTEPCRSRICPSGSWTRNITLAV